jgi:hypothetical protein
VYEYVGIPISSKETGISAIVEALLQGGGSPVDCFDDRLEVAFRAIVELVVDLLSAHANLIRDWNRLGMSQVSYVILRSSRYRT